MKEVKETKNYDIFKKLQGNRGVEKSRVNKIKASIEKVGYITSPIIVNEKMEVIDGQGRLEALKELDLPIEYIVDKGIGIKECISMNIHQTNWSHKDYIKSYAERGYKSYQLLDDLMNEYPEFSVEIFCTVIKGTAKFDIKKLHNGELEVSREQYLSALKKLEYAKKYLKYKNQIHCFKCLMQVIIFCYDFEEVDNERLFNKISKAIEVKNLIPFSTLTDCMQSIEEVYNRHQVRGKHVYIYYIYRKMLEERYGFYMYENMNEEKNIVKMEALS